MSTGANAGTAAAAAGAVVQAIKASGPIVSVDPQDFLSLLYKCEKPLVVMAKGKFLNAHYQYLTSYKGLAFFTKSNTALDLPVEAERIIAQKMWLPR